MNKENLLTLLEINGKLVSKRCTERFLSRHQEALEFVYANSPDDFKTISDKIRYIKYGGGYCEVCGSRTNIAASGQGFAKYCVEHFHEPKKNKKARNRKEVDLEEAYRLYTEGKALIEISQHLGNISNVSLKKKLVQSGFVLRSHSDNQKLRVKKGFYRPKIIIPRVELVEKYKVTKMPMKALALHYSCSEETIRRFLIQEGVARTNRRSYIEHLIISQLDSLGVPYRTNVKNCIPKREIDILVGNVGIEINGLYTHSMVTGNKDRLYHNNKKKLCEEQGVTLLQFWEDDITNRLEIVMSIIKNALNITNTRYHARKCVVRDVGHQESQQFYKNNHLQGIVGNNTKSVGLEYNGELVACLGYVIQKDKTTIVRFCNKLNSSVVGGFSKLLKTIPGARIVTYSHNDISNGDLYNKTGFSKVRENPADMWYTDYKVMMNRQGWMKTKLENKLEIFDSGKTELQNMVDNGYDVIWKSGTKTWELNR